MASVAEVTAAAVVADMAVAVVMATAKTGKRWMRCTANAVVVIPGVAICRINGAVIPPL